jgi:hypothetical protein
MTKVEAEIDAMFAEAEAEMQAEYDAINRQRKAFRDRQDEIDLLMTKRAMERTKPK